MFYAEYNNGKKYYEYCRGYDTALTTATTRPYGFDYTSMTSAEVGDCILRIYQHAFDGCTSLSSCTIGSSVTTIGDGAFNRCSGLTSIDIPSGVTSIGSSVFYFCSSLTSVTVNATTPSTLGLYAFDYTNNCPIYVPSASVGTYKSAGGWRNYTSRIKAIQ
jgi:hypothetical protein